MTVTEVVPTKARDVVAGHVLVIAGKNYYVERTEPWKDGRVRLSGATESGLPWWHDVEPDEDVPLKPEAYEF